MTEPIVYETKPSHQVQAIQFDGSMDSANAITAWYGSFLEGEVWTLIYPLGNMGVMEGDAPILEVNVGNFVYLDEDGFHSVSKNAFEMYYKKFVSSAG